MTHQHRARFVRPAGRIRPALATVCVLGLLALAPGGSGAQSQPAAVPRSPELDALQKHFEIVISRRHQQLFEGLTSTAVWEARKREARASLEQMLWHDMPWPRQPPSAAIAHRTEHDGYVVENIVIESAPGLFATANLYLPTATRGPHPIVLYQCGHASKARYKRHGAWFARHGVAALVIDNIEMGEVEFTHHGVYANGWFHWYSRGFSPLAVELLNAKRAVDYLATRRDLDPKRIGATGRSGGGMTTFFLAALDDRIVASAPVSGTLSTIGWVRDRLSAAHCDCQYPVNSDGLLYSEIGALVAPRAQLLVNADADAGFPTGAFDEMVAKMRVVYDLHGAGKALRTAVAPGGHADTVPIRLPVYAFFLEQFLGRTEPLVDEGPIADPEDDELICYRDGLPTNERLTRIDELLIPAWTPRPGARAPRADRLVTLRRLLRERVFRYFPESPAPLAPEWGEERVVQGRRVRPVTFTSFEGLRVKGIYSLPAASAPARLPALIVVDHRRGVPVWGNEQPLERNQWGDRAVLVVETLDRGSRSLERNLRSAVDDDLAHHMRRQAMVAGTTVESMQVYEILRSVELLRSLPAIDGSRIAVASKGADAVNGLYAALLDGAVSRVILQSPTASHRLGPHYLGVLRYTDVPDVVDLLREQVRLYGDVPAPLSGGAVCGSLADCLR